MFTLAFWRAALERAARTAAQTALPLLGGSGLGLLDIDWLACLSVSGLAAVVSLLTSLATGFATGDSRPGVTERPAATK